MSTDHFTASATDDPHRYAMTASPEACAAFFGRRWLMGGVSFGACLDALERTTGRRLVWASGQFLSSAAEGDQLDLTVEPLVEGGAVTQARAALTCGERKIISVMAALGERHGYPDLQLAKMPDVVGPEKCQPHDEPYPEGPDIRNHFDRLDVPPGRDDTRGYACQWFRSTIGLPVSPGYLAIIADYLPGGHSMGVGSSSFDNMLRIHTIQQSEWILAETRIAGFSSGILHGDTRFFAQDGTFLASAGQSAAMPKRFKLTD